MILGNKKKKYASQYLLNFTEIKKNNSGKERTVLKYFPKPILILQIIVCLF